jgi:glycosyltransferase involved in cell wall biosynthesis
MSISLSILIPAYDYAEGVERILLSLCVDPPDELEIIISDDSRDEQVSQLVANFSFRYGGKLRYIRNRPSLGAIANWNSLLQRASGEYILLLHHDEYPLGERFAQRSLDLLNTVSKVDVFVMECILGSKSGKNMRPHLPKMIRILVLKYFPSYFFRRNVVGPASCLIVRRTLYPRFDKRLRWLVDVDAYYRLRLATGRWCVSEELKIGSILGRNDSITASIKDDLKDLDAQERAYLTQKHLGVKVWLDPNSHLILNAIEWMVWVSMRVVTRLYYWVACHFSNGTN